MSLPYFVCKFDDSKSWLKVAFLTSIGVDQYNVDYEPLSHTRKISKIFAASTRFHEQLSVTDRQVLIDLAND